MTNQILEKLLYSTLYIILFIYDVLTLPLYFFIQRPWKNLELANKCKSKCISSDRHQATYKSDHPIGEYHKLVIKEQADTLEKVFSLVTKIHANRNCLGTRSILEEHEEVQADGKIMKKYIMGSYKWRSFRDAELEAQHFGRGVRELGVIPRERVAIFAETRAEWMIAAQGLFKHSCGVATIYATLGEDGITHAINQTEVSVVITSHDLMPKVKKILDKVPLVRTIIYFEDQLHKTNIDGLEKLNVMGYRDVVEMGKRSTFANVSPTKDDLAILMYTSGSTGVPKGVLLTHNNLLTTMKGFLDFYDIYPTDILLGLLPLAHCYELLAECCSMLAGVPIGYSSPLTLIDSSPKISKGQVGDARMLKPTVMTSVPLLLDRIVKGIRDKVDKGPLMTRILFYFAYNYKKKWFKRGYGTPIVDRIVFKKVKNIIGGNLRAVVSGGAPLSPETHETIRLCLCVNTAQGYGCTETSASGSLMDKYDMSTGRSGCPVTTNYIRLINWEEGNYFVTNRPNPQGEVLIGGENIADGYYKMPEETEGSFYEDETARWFRTGDVGEIQSDGTIKIIDRKKDLVKLQHGEYISLGRIESILKTCKVVENVCIYADSTKTYCMALVQPAERGLMDLAESIGINQDFDDLCENQDVIKAANDLLANYGRERGLNKFEIPTKIALCKELWTPDSGLVTAAFKIKRKDVQKKYQNVINKLYR
ncbi:unnamed protein product [Chironomus riparius]|uniref:long-chain-fatty-acid--CoA ligase n=1 Tax=Chironomus riparius TaxID=315576 RepID=A0A9N9WYG1_9DIPT|nr:unnamed protein product [Chironomus riparius]